MDPWLLDNNLNRRLWVLARAAQTQTAASIRVQVCACLLLPVCSSARAFQGGVGDRAGILELEQSLRECLDANAWICICLHREPSLSPSDLNCHNAVIPNWFRGNADGGGALQSSVLPLNRENLMLRPILATVGMTLMLTMSTVHAQQTPAPADEPPAAQPDPAMVGLPVYSSDGQKLGQITEVGIAGGQQAVRAEMKEFLGGTSTTVVINANIMQKKADRVELAMTAGEVKDVVSKQQQGQKPQ